MKILLRNHNQVLSDISKKFDIVNYVDEADRVVLWNDVTFIERGMANLAKLSKVPSIVVQHGRKGTSRYYSPFNEPIIVDKLLVWGNRDKKTLIEAGHPEEKIKVCGTTIFKYFKKREEHKGINVVFSPDHWDREIDENKRVAEELRNLKRVNVITKIIEVNDSKLYDNVIFSDRSKGSHLKICAEVLSTADIVVAISEGTFELMAQYLNIPVIIMDEWEPKSFGGDIRYHSYYRPISEGAKRTGIKNLNKTIRQQLKNPDELKKEREIIVREEGGTDIINPLEKICQEIESF